MRQRSEFRARWRAPIRAVMAAAALAAPLVAAAPAAQAQGGGIANLETLERLAAMSRNERVEALRALQPRFARANCPASAGALQNYLDSGLARPARGGTGDVDFINCGAPMVTVTVRSLLQRVRAGGHGYRLVVGGFAPGRQHYAVVVNIRGTPFYLDAYTRPPIFDDSVAGRLSWATELEATENFQPHMVPRPPPGASRTAPPRCPASSAAGRSPKPGGDPPRLLECRGAEGGGGGSCDPAASADCEHEGDGGAAACGVARADATPRLRRDYRNVEEHAQDTCSGPQYRPDPDDSVATRRAKQERRQKCEDERQLANRLMSFIEQNCPLHRAVHHGCRMMGAPSCRALEASGAEGPFGDADPSARFDAEFIAVLMREGQNVGRFSAEACADVQAFERRNAALIARVMGPGEVGHAVPALRSLACSAAEAMGGPAGPFGAGGLPAPFPLPEP